MMRRAASVALIAAAVAMASLLAAGCQTPGAVLKGRLTDSSDGSHPVGVSVAVYSNTTDTVAAQTTTDSQGDYSFLSSAVPDGTYRVLFSSSDWWNQVGDWTDATPVAVAAATPVTINETLDPAAGSVAGTVTDPASNPVTGVNVAAVNPSNTTVASTTATDGTYGFAALPAGSYVFEFSAPGYTTRYNDNADTRAAAPSVTVSDGSTTTGIDTTLAPQAGITGTVTNGSAPLGGIVVLAYDATGGRTSGAITASDGTFHIASLDAAPYTLELIDPTGAMHTEVWGSTSTDPTTGTPITPPAGATAGVGSIALVGHDCHLDATPYATTLSNANLTNCNLTAADLSGANLTGAELVGANLAGAHLTGATLTGADLGGADLTNAALDDVISGGITGTPASLPSAWILTHGYLVGYSANLTGANLFGVDLQHVDLHDADLTGATLTGADLGGADLTNAALDDVISGGITGTPASLPSAWILTQGYLVGYSANLTGANLFGVDLQHVDLHDADLTGADLVEADLNGANLAGVDLQHVDFQYANLDNADLVGADVSGDNLTSASLADTNFSSAYLIDTDLTGAELTGTNFTEASLDSATLSESSAYQTHFNGADLTYANLTYAYVGLADFTFANLDSANLSGATLDHPTFTWTNFTGADLTGAELTGAVLVEADLSSAVLTKVTSRQITGSQLTLPTGWTLTQGYLVGPGANLNIAELTNADLTGADLAGTNLIAADLTGTTLTGADLTGADLTGADLTGADLTNADLTNADLTNADLTGAALTGVTSSGLVGTPAALPAGWTIVSGTLVGPG